MTLGQQQLLSWTGQCHVIIVKLQLGAKVLLQRKEQKASPTKKKPQRTEHAQNLIVKSKLYTIILLLYSTLSLTIIVKGQVHLVEGDNMLSLPQVHPPVDACIAPRRGFPMKILGCSWRKYQWMQSPSLYLMNTHSESYQKWTYDTLSCSPTLALSDLTPPLRWHNGHCPLWEWDHLKERMD